MKQLKILVDIIFKVCILFSISNLLIFTSLMDYEYSLDLNELIQHHFLSFNIFKIQRLCYLYVGTIWVYRLSYTY